jgi:hypothetical protein
MNARMSEKPHATLSSTKNLILLSKEPSSQDTNPNPKLPKKKRDSSIDSWIATANTYSTQESQLLLLMNIKTVLLSESENILRSHLKTKQSGYRSQDTIKNLYDAERFIKLNEMVDLLIESNLSCFYCRKWATLFYENVREPRQWSLERLSNAEGHNRDNVVIACLECNMRRRTMYHERYIITKQLKVNKLSGDESDQTI